MFSKLINGSKTTCRNAISYVKDKLSGNKHTQKIMKLINDKNQDLPLDNSPDSKFLILLIALMSFLAVLALSGTFALNSMTEKWSSGLENKVTIEISIETKDGHILSQDTVLKETKDLYAMLSEHKVVKSAEVLGDKEIQELISPWIGNDLSLGDIPLPGLIALELRKVDANGLNNLKNDIQKISKHAMLETHHEWLSDLINFTSTLKALALMVALIIAAITTIAISSAIRTRLAIHNSVVELLHYMGATDNYIARQFQKHAMILSLKGAVIGTAIGLAATFLLAFLSRNTGTDLIPVIHIGSLGVLILCLVPVLVSLITILTSHITVLRSLSKMP